MTNIDEAAEVRREASGLLQLLSAAIGQPRYAMGKRVSVALQVVPTDAEGNECRVEVLCHAFGSLDADWDNFHVVLTDGAGEPYRLDLNRRGHAATICVLTPGAVLRGKAIESSIALTVVAFPSRRTAREDQTVLEGLGAAAQTGVGELFVETTKDFVSADGHVHAKVHCAVGGDLSVTFSASSKHADLVGSRIQFRFFTDAGTELRGERELWPDEGEDDQLTAFWGENQTGLAPAGEAGAGGPAKKLNLAFEFEVLPLGTRPPEG